MAAISAAVISPRPERNGEWWGKAIFSVLEHERLPMIDAEYASNAQFDQIRPISGQVSILYSAIYAAGNAGAIQTLNPAWHRNLGYFRPGKCLCKSRACLSPRVSS